MLTAERLVTDHLDSLYGLARAWARDSVLAEDLTHRTFLKAFEKLGQLRDPNAVRSWLICILRNEVASEFRSQGRLIPWDQDALEALPDAPCDPLLGHEALEVLPLAMERIPEASRHILLLRFQQELSYEEIAHTLSLPLGTVMSRLHRAKAALKAQVQALGGLTQEGAV